MNTPVATISIYDVLVKAHPEILAALGEEEIRRRIAERNKRSMAAHIELVESFKQGNAFQRDRSI